MDMRWHGVQMGVLQEFGDALCCSLGWVPSYSGNAPIWGSYIRMGRNTTQCTFHLVPHFEESSIGKLHFEECSRVFWKPFLIYLSYKIYLPNRTRVSSSGLMIWKSTHFVSFIGDSITVEQQWGFLFTHLNRFQYCFCAFSKSSTTVSLYQFCPKFFAAECVGVPFTVSPVLISTPHLSSPWINSCRTANMQTLPKPTINAMRKYPFETSHKWKATESIHHQFNRVETPE